MQQNKEYGYLLLWVGTILAFAVTLGLQTLFDDGTIVSSVVVTLINAALTVGILWLCIKKRPFEKAKASAMNPIPWTILIVVCCAGLVQGIPAWVNCFTDAGTRASTNNVQLVSLVVGLCLLTGVYEEGLFRGLFLPALLQRFSTSRRPLLVACVVSSLLFAALHIGWGWVMPHDVPSCILLVLKPLQAFAFSWCMVYICLGQKDRVGICMAVHGLFDVLALAPLVIASGQLSQAYGVGGWADVSVLATSVVVLALAAGALARGTIDRFDEK